MIKLVPKLLFFLQTEIIITVETELSQARSAKSDSDFLKNNIPPKKYNREQTRLTVTSDQSTGTCEILLRSNVIEPDSGFSAMRYFIQ